MKYKSVPLFPEAEKHEDVFLDKEGVKSVDQDEYIKKVVAHYRKVGFPFPRLSEHQKIREYNRLIYSDPESIAHDDYIYPSSAGIALAWTYFPHAFAVQCKDSLSPMEAFNDDYMLGRVVAKTLLLDGYVTDATLRKTIKIASIKTAPDKPTRRIQAVSNFRPLAAAVLYNRYCPQGGRIYDMSCGFGGRLLGFYTSKASTYIGVDPSTPTFNGLNKIIADVNRYQQSGVLKLRYPKDEIRVVQSGSEDYVPGDNDIDVCFTSPPYFNTEKYTDEDTQSWKKFGEYDSWLNDFIRKTFENCWVALKPGGKLIVNIANTYRQKTLADDTHDVAKSIGFVPVEILKLVFPIIMSKTGQALNKTEPIFVLEKP